MFHLCKIISHEGNRMTIEFEEEINAEYLKMLARGKDNLVKVKPIDNEPLSAKQNALSHVLIRDIANWWVDDPEHVESILKYDYEYDQDEAFSHELATMDEGNIWITKLIQFVVKEGVELKKRYSYLLEQNSFFYYCCKYRKCAVCGRPHAQIHHVTAVGNRHRKNVDHRLFPFASLCWVHHNIAHDLGQTEFLNKYQITAVYLDKDALIKIGIMTNAQIMKFDEKYETEQLFNRAVEGG
nr:hypothetical protein [Enterococcus sp. 665A]